MILCIGTTPAAQRVMIFPKFELGEVNRARATLDGAAGKSINVAKVLSIFGARPLATGFIGGDRGNALLESLASRKIQTEFVRVRESTRQCLSVLDESSHRVTELVEESKPVTSSNYAALRKIIKRHLANCQAVIMSGSLTPGGPVDFYKGITQHARAAGILTIVDAQGPPLAKALLAKPALVKPNRQELAATIHQTLRNESEVIGAMRQLRRRGAGRIVVTCGKSEVLSMDDDSVCRIQPPVISPVNPIGSGDAFTAALVWRLVQNDNLGEACRWAAAAGAANALSAMPGDLDRIDIQRLAEKIEVKRL
jgi:tagatose 6-phosphate kinase